MGNKIYKRFKMMKDKALLVIFLGGICIFLILLINFGVGYNPEIQDISKFSASLIVFFTLSYVIITIVGETITNPHLKEGLNTKPKSA